jgi:hypothetical protein
MTVNTVIKERKSDGCLRLREIILSYIMPRKSYILMMMMSTLY